MTFRHGPSLSRQYVFVGRILWVCPYLFTGKERRIGSWAWSIEDLVYMVVSGIPVGRVRRPVQGHRGFVVSVIGVTSHLAPLLALEDRNFGACH